MKNFKEFFSFNFYLIKGKEKFPDRCPFEEFVTNHIFNFVQKIFSNTKVSFSHSKINTKKISKNKENFDSTDHTYNPGNEKEDHAIARKRRIVKNSSGRSRKLADPKRIGHDGNQVSRLPAAWRGPS